MYRNLRISVKNIHFRLEHVFEDGERISVGVIVRDAQFYTVDETGQEIINLNSDGPIHKRLIMRGVSVYLDSNPKTIDLNSFDKEMESSMNTQHKLMIRDFVIDVTLTQGQECENSLKVMLSELVIRLSRIQYQQLRKIDDERRRDMDESANPAELCDLGSQKPPFTRSSDFVIFFEVRRIRTVLWNEGTIATLILDSLVGSLAFKDGVKLEGSLKNISVLNACQDIVFGVHNQNEIDNCTELLFVHSNKDHEQNIRLSGKSFEMNCDLRLLRDLRLFCDIPVSINESVTDNPGLSVPLVKYDSTDAEIEDLIKQCVARSAKIHFDALKVTLPADTPIMLTTENLDIHSIDPNTERSLANQESWLERFTATNRSLRLRKYMSSVVLMNYVSNSIWN
jgi:hypothetical protein